MPRLGATAEERAIAEWLRENADKVWQRRSWRIWQWYGRWVARNAWRVAADEVYRRANMRDAGVEP